MEEYILRWQYGVIIGQTKTHYTYGNLNMLRQKAKTLEKDDRVTYITIDKVKEVVKDIRFERLEELLK